MYNKYDNIGIPMPNKDEGVFDAPIPGQSLTGELGSKPWEQPPKYNTVEEALDFYLPRLSNGDLLTPLLDELEEGIPVVSLVNIIQSGGTMQGLHTIDIGLLISPVLVEFIAAQADARDIKYTLGTEDKDIPTESNMRKVMRRVGRQDDVPVEATAAPLEEEAPIESGIMSKRA
jgi:hypothetical protein